MCVINATSADHVDVLIYALELGERSRHARAAVATGWVPAGLAFMASAPRGQHELDFEAEEAAILSAVGQTRIDLMVEDTGDPEHLGRRLAGTQAEKIIGAETINYETDTVAAELRERTGGRGPDICIEAVGMEADSPGPQYLCNQVKQQLRLETDRAIAFRQAIHACRKGGGVFALGVCAGLVDKFPLGAVMNKSLTLRGAQQHGHRYIPEILDLRARGEVKASHLATHVMPLTEGPTGYRMFKNKEDGCARAVFQPAGADRPPPVTRVMARLARSSLGNRAITIIDRPAGLDVRSYVRTQAPCMDIGLRTGRWRLQARLRLGPSSAGKVPVPGHQGARCHDPGGKHITISPVRPRARDLPANPLRSAGGSGPVMTARKRQ